MGKYLDIARRARQEMFPDRDMYLSGMTKIERQAYDEWFETMLGEPFRMKPEEAHRKTRELLEASRKFLEANPHLKADPCR
ncbi:MAG: hypothetical protein HZA02_05235 [Nitrospinae bacterium]|nr:hypothetical protein [Nitrospinota bacterium]